MTTAYTSLLGLALPVTGELAGTWGDTVNNYITSYLDAAVAGAQTISGTQTAVTLSVTNGSSLTQVGGSGSTGSSQYQIINCTGNPAGLLTITAPAASKVYLILNSTSTSQSVKIVGTGPTTGVTIISGEKALVAWNGSDFVKVASTAAAGGSNTQVQYNNNGVLAGSANLTFDGTSLTLGGNPTLSAGTANGVLYLNGSKVATSGSALTWNGSALNVGGSGVSVLDDQYFYFAGGASYIQGSTASNYIKFGITSAEQMRLTSTGLGIGTSSPSQKLTVSGNGAFTGYIKSTGDGFYSGASAQASFGTANLAITGGSSNDAAINISGSNNIVFGIGSTEKMRLDSSGNLGLGVVPSRLIDAQKDQNAATQFRIRNDNNGTASQSSVSASYGDFAQYITMGQYSPSFTTSGLRAANSSGVFTSGNTNGLRVYTIDSTPLIFGTADTERARIDSSGNVGIGTSSPATKLHISGSTTPNLRFEQTNSSVVHQFQAASGNFFLNIDATNAIGGSTFLIQQAGSTVATLSSTGNLGLGVTPSAWNSDYKNFAVGTGGEFYGRVSTTEVGIGSNYYRNAAGNFIYLTTAAASYQAQVGGVHYWNTAPSGTAGNAISFTQAMTLNASGYLGIGETNPSYPIHINGGTNPAAIAFQSSISTGISYKIAQGIQGATNAGLQIYDLTNSAVRLAIDSSGNLLVGATTAGNNGITLSNSTVSPTVGVVGSASTSGNYGFTMYSTGVSANRFLVDYAGTIFATNTTISAISDQRFKENVRDLDVGLDAVMALKPRKFDWKAGKGKDIKNDRGFIAQEFEQVFPDLVDEWADPAPEGEDPYKSVRQDLIPVLVKAIQELKAEVDSLKSQLKGA